MSALIDETETWFLRQLPVFAQADPKKLPLDLKGALADMVYDALFDSQGKYRAGGKPGG